MVQVLISLSDLCAMSQQIESLRETLDRERESHDDTRRTLDNWQRQCRTNSDIYHKRIVSLHAQISDRTDERDAMSDGIDQLSEIIADNADTIERLNNQCDTFQSLYRDMGERYDTLKEQCQIVSDTSGAIINQQNERINRLISVAPRIACAVKRDKLSYHDHRALLALSVGDTHRALSVLVNSINHGVCLTLAQAKERRDYLSNRYTF